MRVKVRVKVRVRARARVRVRVGHDQRTLDSHGEVMPARPVFSRGGEVGHVSVQRIRVQLYMNVYEWMN